VPRKCMDLHSCSTALKCHFETWKKNFDNCLFKVAVLRFKTMTT
jgi:hypothetical protein